MHKTKCLSDYDKAMALPGTPSISTQEKPTRHVSFQTWTRRVEDLTNLTTGRRQDAYLMRNQTHQVRNETEIAATWKHYHTNTKLSDRIIDERQRWENLKASKLVLDEEIVKLNEEKIEGERQIEAYYRALTVVGECLLIRDNRDEIDLLHDESHKQLLLELELLERSKEKLTSKVTEAFDTLCLMKEISAKLGDTIAVKGETIKIDETALALEKESTLTSFKPDVLRMSSEILSLETWMQLAQGQQAEADEQIQIGERIRESLRLSKERVKMDFLTQVEATNYSIRRQLHNFNIAKNELQWQRKNTAEELVKVAEEIENLKAARIKEEAVLKCCETRQEDRNMRPAQELTRDDPHVNLMEEISEARRSIRNIIDKTNDTIHIYNDLESLVVRLDQEIAQKERTIRLELQCFDCRSNLLEHQPTATLDKDVILVKMEKQVAPKPL